MHVAESRTIASVGSTMLGASRSSKRTSRGPCRTAARMSSRPFRGTADGEPDRGTPLESHASRDAAEEGWQPEGTFAVSDAIGQPEEVRAGGAPYPDHRSVSVVP